MAKTGNTRINHAPATTPVTVGGWYSLTDGRWANFQWRRGQVVCVAEAASPPVDTKEQSYRDEINTADARK